MYHAVVYLRMDKRALGEQLKPTEEATSQRYIGRFFWTRNILENPPDQKAMICGSYRRLGQFLPLDFLACLPLICDAQMESFSSSYARYF